MTPPYVAEDPINFVDPSGKQRIILVVPDDRKARPGAPILPEWPAEELGDAIQDLLDWHHDATCDFISMVGEFCTRVFSKRERKEIEALIEQVKGEKATDETYDQVSDEIHDRKDRGPRGTRNKNGDYTKEELREIIQDVLGGRSKIRRLISDGR